MYIWKWKKNYYKIWRHWNWKTKISSAIPPVFKTGKDHYPQVFLEESKFVLEEKKMPGYDLNNSYDRFNFKRKSKKKI